MLLRILWRSFARRPGRTAVTVLAVAIGASLATALLSVSFGITDRVEKELKAFGANIRVVPESQRLQVEAGGIRYSAPAATGYLEEADLPNLKTIFWGNNIVGFAPFLSGPVEVAGRPAVLVGTWLEKRVPVPTETRTIVLPGGGTREVTPESDVFVTGMRRIAPWWRVSGDWETAGEPGPGTLVGTDLAARLGVAPGDRLAVGYEGSTYSLRVDGILATGGPEDGQLIVDLSLAQRVFGLPGKVDSILVSALVKPDDELAERARRNLGGLSEADYVRWYCSPYIGSITYQIQEAIHGSTASPIPRVAQAEAAFLRRVALTLGVVTLAALVAAALAVMATMTISVLERVPEIGLMKALGGQDRQIAIQFALEAVALGLLGGILGYASGVGLSRVVGMRVFGTTAASDAAVLPLALGIALGVAVLGSVAPIRRAIRVDPVLVLRGR